MRGVGVWSRESGNYIISLTNFKKEIDFLKNAGFGFSGDGN